MFMVYWTVADGNADHAQARCFPSDEMGAALKFMETLRGRQRDGDDIGFITMCSENPHSVGHPGVADPSPDYNWKKRRP
ncbi:MAG TPA: hypothetical protein VIM12_02655 [Noviherbaspirillum sp.]|jgi:hypothetical protein|uniref:hypothetical protein n=1 Tax=Noviherbaspirillum sp. TaxID=1926288 RepID=UPI002F93D7BE